MPPKRKRCNTSENLLVDDYDTDARPNPSKRSASGTQMSSSCGQQALQLASAKNLKTTNFPSQIIMPPPPIPPLGLTHAYSAYSGNQQPPLYNTFNDISNMYGQHKPTGSNSGSSANLDHSNNKTNYSNKNSSNMSCYPSQSSLSCSGSSTSSLLSHAAASFHNPPTDKSKKQSTAATNGQTRVLSSYYTLTPASSTSSLADFANTSYYHNNQQQHQHDHMNVSLNTTAVSMVSTVSNARQPQSPPQKQEKKTRVRRAKTTVLSSTTTTTVMSSSVLETTIVQAQATNSSQLNTSDASSTISNSSYASSTTGPTTTASESEPAEQPVKKRRGRPPKNATTALQQQKAPTPVAANQQQLQLVSIIPNPQSIIPANITMVTTNINLMGKLTKSIVLKSSNLQRQKTTTAIDSNAELPTMTRLMAMYCSKSRSDENERATPMPSITWANGDEVWRAMRANELAYRHDVGYTRRHRTVLPHMRGILLDWLVEIAHAYRFHRETFHLCVEYLDRFMSSCEIEIRVDRLQLIGMTCLYLAAKVEEIYPPKLADMASHMEEYNDNNETAVQQFELFVLKTLEWRVSPVTANVWLQAYLQIAAHNPHIATCLGGGSHDPAEVAKSRVWLLNGSGGSGYNNKNGATQSTRFTLPLGLFRNEPPHTRTPITAGFTSKQEQFYLSSYMKAVTLLDLCTFDMDSLRFSYSILAATAMLLMLQMSTANGSAIDELSARVVQECTGYALDALRPCVEWMSAYAVVCRDVLTVQGMVTVRKFTTVDDDDAHNIQLFHQNLELLKKVQLKKTTQQSLLL